MIGRRQVGARTEDAHHIFEIRPGWMGCYFNFTTPARWNSVRKKLEVAGGLIGQNGDTDGIVHFSTQDEALVRLVIKLAGVRIKRNISDEQRAAIKARFSKKG